MIKNFIQNFNNSIVLIRILVHVLAIMWAMSLNFIGMEIETIIGIVVWILLSTQMPILTP